MFGDGLDSLEELRGRHLDQEPPPPRVDEEPWEFQDGLLDVDGELSCAEGADDANRVAGVPLGVSWVAGGDGISANDPGRLLCGDLPVAVH